MHDALGRLTPGGTAVFVFSTMLTSRFFRSIATLLYRAAHGRFVDAGSLRALPGLERMETSAGGIATLAVFRPPPG